MKKLVIFSHHYVSNEIVKRYENLQNLNPEWDIKPIGFDGNYELLPGSVVIDKNKYPSNRLLAKSKSGTPWREDWLDPDLLLYDAYYQFPNYEAYFLYEYDTICNASIDSFFDTSLDCFGNTTQNPMPEFMKNNWRNLYFNLNPHHIKEVSTYGVSTCIYAKNNILSKVFEEVTTNKHLYCDMLSELRGGTLFSKFAALNRGRPDIKNFISFQRKNINVNLNEPYFYHPIKPNDIIYK